MNWVLALWPSSIAATATVAFRLGRWATKSEQYGRHALTRRPVRTDDDPDTIPIPELRLRRSAGRLVLPPDPGHTRPPGVDPRNADRRKR